MTFFYFKISFIVSIEISNLGETFENCQYDLIFYLMIHFRGVATYLIANAVYIAGIAIIDTILTYLVLGLFFAFVNLELELI